MARILITGGSGFLGSALGLHFLGQGHSVTLVLRPASSTWRIKNHIRELCIARISGPEELSRLVLETKPEAILHTACNYGRHSETAKEILDTNLDLGIFLLEAARRLSHSVTFVNTGTVLARDVNAYALSKAQFAEWGRMLANSSEGQLMFLNVLLQHMYGPGDDASKFSSHIISSCLRNIPDLPLTPGAQQRDFIYIDDVVTAYHALIQHVPHRSGAMDVQVGSGEARTLRSFAQIVHRLTRSTTTLRFGALAYRPNEPMHCQADLGFMNSIGWAPQVNLEEGLQRTISAESDINAGSR